MVVFSHAHNTLLLLNERPHLKKLPRYFDHSRFGGTGRYVALFRCYIPHKMVLGKQGNSRVWVRTFPPARNPYSTVVQANYAT
jgi:hypothetical protein